MGRSSKALKNVATGLINKVLMLFLAFATRTLFIRLLGAEYTGVSSLYTNILSVLSLAELGLSNVLMFYLYGAIKDQDEDRICSLVQEFKKIYTGIIILVLSIGLILIPFLRYIVKSTLPTNEVIIYYILYLVNSVASYFVVYRTMVIKADQQDYISNIVQTATTVTMYVLQIVYLLIAQNFLGYLVIQVICTISNNIILNYIALKKYPYLRKTIKSEKAVIKRRELFGNIKATFLFKISDTILDQTDSIIISVMFGTVFVGYYFNYYMLITYIVAIAGIVANGLVASFGNLNAEGNMEQSYKMFRVALLGFAIFGTFCTACYACVVQDFIPIWVGSEYVMDYRLVFAVLAVFYLRMVTNTMWMYRSSMGIFKEVQYINIAAAALNIVLSIILGKWIGVPGVIVATALSRLLTSFWYEGKVVFERFGKSVSIYYKQQLKDFLICAAVVSLSLLLCRFITFGGVRGLIVKLLIAVTVTLIIELTIYYRSPEFKLMTQKIKGVLKKA